MCGGTAICGFGANGGLVNIVTRRPEDGAFNVNASGGLDVSATHPSDSSRCASPSGGDD